MNATREPEHEVDDLPKCTNLAVTKRCHHFTADRNFVWLLISRMLSQFGIMGFAFYAVLCGAQIRGVRDPGRP